MLLCDATDLTRHLRHAINGRRRWVFVGQGDGCRALGLVGFLLATRWSLLGLDADRLLRLGEVDFTNLPTRHRGRFVVLTAPKAALSREELGLLLRLVRRDTVLPDAGQDLIVLCDPAGPACGGRTGRPRLRTGRRGSGAWR